MTVIFNVFGLTVKFPFLLHWFYWNVRISVGHRFFAIFSFWAEWLQIIFTLLCYLWGCMVEWKEGAFWNMKKNHFISCPIISSLVMLGMWISKLYLDKMEMITDFTVIIKIISVSLPVYLSIHPGILASNNYSRNLKPFLLHPLLLQSKPYFKMMSCGRRN